MVVRRCRSGWQPPAPEAARKLASTRHFFARRLPGLAPSLLLGGPTPVVGTGDATQRRCASHEEGESKAMSKTKTDDAPGSIVLEPPEWSARVTLVSGALAAL